MAVWVCDVVSQFDFVERHSVFAHPMFSGSWRIRVDKHPLWHLRIGFASHNPLGIVEFVAVLISRDDIHQHYVFCFLVQASDVDFKGWKHSPGKERRYIQIGKLDCWLSRNMFIFNTRGLGFKPWLVKLKTTLI